jgi:hypothetical protein
MQKQKLTLPFTLSRLKRKIYSAKFTPRTIKKQHAVFPLTFPVALWFHTQTSPGD